MPNLRSDALREVGDRARELEKLRDHPSWKQLHKEWELLRRLYVDQQARKMFNGGLAAKPLDQRELDYKRGFIAGAAWLLSLPEMAIKALEIELTKVDNNESS